MSFSLLNALLFSMQNHTISSTRFITETSFHTSLHQCFAMSSSRMITSCSKMSTLNRKQELHKLLLTSTIFLISTRLSSIIILNFFGMKQSITQHMAFQSKQMNSRKQNQFNRAMIAISMTQKTLSISTKSRISTLSSTKISLETQHSRIQFIFHQIRRIIPGSLKTTNQKLQKYLAKQKAKILHGEPIPKHLKQHVVNNSSKTCKQILAISKITLNHQMQHNLHSSSQS